jgi:hypothetical protein
VSARDPRWLALAEAAYALLLKLYPPGLRKAHGEEMRQAFRDRCREVAAGRTRAWQLFPLELLPDLCSSLARSHVSEQRGATSPRALACIAMLALLALWILFQQALSPRLNDTVFALKSNWQHWREERALLRDEAQVRHIADQLAASTRDEDRALAAYLYRVNERGRDYEATFSIGSSPIEFGPLPADGERATRLLAELPVDGNLRSRRLALLACTLASGCDRQARVHALLRSEPDNAYAWAQQFKLDGLAGNEAALAADLSQAARSRHYESGENDARASALAAVVRLAPDDAAALAGVARRLTPPIGFDSEEFRHNLRYQCSIVPIGGSAWLRQHPASLPDCRSFATLGANSMEPDTSFWGWRWLDRDRSTPETSAGIESARRRWSQAWNLGTTQLEGDRARPWSDAEWQAWASAKIKEAGL